MRGLMNHGGFAFAVLEQIDQIKILVCLPKMNDLTFLSK